MCENPLCDIAKCPPTLIDPLVAFEHVFGEILTTGSSIAEDFESELGITYAEGTLTGPNGKQAVVRFLVDSGAVYTLVPHDVWKALDLQPKRTQNFSLADGTQIARSVSECHIAMPQGDSHTPVIL